METRTSIDTHIENLTANEIKVKSWEGVRYTVQIAGVCFYLNAEDFHHVFVPTMFVKMGETFADIREEPYLD